MDPHEDSIDNLIGLLNDTDFKPEIQKSQTTNTNAAVSTTAKDSESNASLTKE